MNGKSVTICVLCLLCAAHTRCNVNNDIHIKHNVSGKLSPTDLDKLLHISLSSTDSENFSVELVDRIFENFGNGNSLSKEGFENVMQRIKLVYYMSNKTVPDHKIVFGGENQTDLFASNENVKNYGTDMTDPNHHHHHMHINDGSKDMAAVWLYATASIIVISLCGLAGVAVIPVMQQVFYQHLLQFLVALAVGTLCGDALLHLLPHAMLSTHSHSHSTVIPAVDNHDINMWRGFVAMVGIVFFYMTEKCLAMVASLRKRIQRKPENGTVPRVRVMRDSESSYKPAVGEKLSKYSSYPYCYGEITNNTDNLQKNGSTDGVDSNLLPKPREENGAANNYDVRLNQKAPSENAETEETHNTKESDCKEPSNTADDGFTIIIREHETTHHGRSHTHGHVHEAPKSLSSVAWMVVMGDGLHNFADGVSIGAAFSANIAGGFSTALAVFMHELPHELGDFAVLLKAGMSAKEAVFYNLLSSILCFIGMCLGVWLGHNEEATQWVFSAAAGMFLYIALVDMIPELSSSPTKELGSLCQCALQFAGLSCGVLIMLLIAFYERDLKNVFKDDF
ncbi:zinc transporter foi [Nilaparvata lugens]|uniref:zinc transporter foi n=1 Tax=Nilaparvata lugens TaxID=108931 RepID=UPI00193EA4B3|nr:zinc transporter foi [Nilaparvata lugens]